MEPGDNEPLPPRCLVEAWRPKIPGIAEVFHARIVDYDYPPHSHDTWTVLSVDAGAIAFDLDRRARRVQRRSVALLPPGVTHDGGPAPGTRGFTKRVLYLDQWALPSDLTGAAVDQTTIDDATLYHRLATLHQQLAIDGDTLLSESLLALVTEQLTDHLLGTDTSERAADPRLARQLRDLLDASVTSGISLDDTARDLGCSKAHLIRTFRRAYGLPPHAHLIARRIEVARRMLLDGARPAEVATSTGFYDQAHLTRHFKRHTSVAPAAYATSHNR